MEKKKKKKPWTPSDVNRCFETKPVKLQQATNILKAQNIYQIRIFLKINTKWRIMEFGSTFWSCHFHTLSKDVSQLTC